MSDQDALTAMFDRVGIVWAYEDGALRIIAKDGPKNNGYSGFFTDFIFDADGTLTEVGIWE